ncbi:MAG TPA: hypothetical protein VN408_22605 [Actinoplanes sp.]|nr:hypothetical protein [Actinoplanes sp.]
MHNLLRLYAGDLIVSEKAPADRDDCTGRPLTWTVTTATTGPGRWRLDELDDAFAPRPGRPHRPARGGPEPADAVHERLTAAGDHVYRLPVWQAPASAAAGRGDDLKQARPLRWVAHSYRGAPYRRL